MARRLVRRTLKRRPPRRRWPVAAAALAVLLAWWLWPEPDAEPPPPPSIQAAPVELVASPIRLRRKTAPPPQQLALPERDALLAAVRERASTLRDCALPGGTLARLPMRLHLRKSGAMRALDFTGEPPPPRVASCVRKAAMKWEFDRIRLPTDTELLVAISFTP